MNDYVQVLVADIFIFHRAIPRSRINRLCNNYAFATLGTTEIFSKALYHFILTIVIYESYSYSTFLPTLSIVNFLILAIVTLSHDN